MKKIREVDAKTEALKAQAKRDEEEAHKISSAHHERQSAALMAKEAKENLENVKRQWGRK